MKIDDLHAHNTAKSNVSFVILYTDLLFSLVSLNLALTMTACSPSKYPRLS